MTRCHVQTRRSRRPATLAAPLPALLAALLAVAGCTFDFDTNDYQYPGEGQPLLCTTDADCAGRAAATCVVWACGDGGQCEEAQAAEGASCDDGNLCTEGSTCTAGACGGGSATCDDGQACTLDTCAPATGACAHVPDDGLCSGGALCLTPHCDPARGCILLPMADGDPCDDDDACTIDDQCAQGRCDGTPATCEPSGPCFDATCDPGAGCEEAAAQDGTPCPKPDPCAERGTCRAGACVAEGSLCECEEDADCDAVQPEDRCLGRYGCVGNACVIDPETVVVCPAPPEGSCVAARCVPDTGVCEEERRPTGAGCDDGNVCTVDDVCDDDGGCGGAPKCDDGDPCSTDACDASGVCDHVPLPEGGACDDGDARTVTDVCTNGVCRGWTVTWWRDLDRETRLEGVSWSRDGFFAAGRSGADGTEAAFLASLPVAGEPARLPGTDLPGGRWRRMNGGVAVGTGAHVAVHESWGWDSESAIADAVAALDAPAPAALRGVWRTAWTAGDNGATVDAVWLSGERSSPDATLPAAWLARCASVGGAPWGCVWLGDAPAFRDDHALEAVAAFVTPLTACAAGDAPLCFDPDGSLAAATGASVDGTTAAGLYRGRLDGNGEAWQDARILGGGAGVLRDLHGSARDDVWAVGTTGLLAHWTGAAWSTTAVAAMSGWDLNGVWAHGSLVLIAASRVERETGTTGAAVLHLAVFAGRPNGPTTTWLRLDLLESTVCAAGEVCPTATEDVGALEDVWAHGEADGPTSVVAVGHVRPPDGSPRKAVVFRRTLP